MKENKKKRKQVWFWVLFSALCIILLFVSKNMMDTKWSFLQDAIISVFCSIVASGIYALLQTSSDLEEKEKILENINRINCEFIDREQEVIKRISDDLLARENGELRRIDEELGIMNNMLKKNNDLFDSGIVSIRKKSYYEDSGDFWNDIINSTSDRLDLIGHTIYNWFKPDHKDTFTNKLKEMLEAGKTVRIILSESTPDMELIHKIEKNGGKETQKCRLLNKIDKTCYELRKIYREIPEEKRDNFKVYLADYTQVNYMYIRTDKQCFISPYITNKNNDANTFLLELRTKIEYSKCFDEDFDELVKNIDMMLDMEG